MLGYGMEVSDANDNSVLRVEAINQRESTMTRYLVCAGWLSLIAVITCGCSKSPTFPAGLAQQIATADRVVLTNHSSRVTFSGSEAQQLVQAVSHSKIVRMPKDAAPSCPAGFYLQFYKGTNLLTQVDGHDNHFHTSEGDVYQDDTRVLQAAWQAVYEEARR